MNPFFSIITPTLLRTSLIPCCGSVDKQSFTSWQHVLQVDGVTSTGKPYNDVLGELSYDQRSVETCLERHGNFGNHCRHIAWERASGEYLIYLDDDNSLFNEDALANIFSYLALADFPDFAIFPIHRHGHVFFNDPPGLCMTDTANFVVKREIGRWPNIEAREADGHFIEELRSKYSYAAFPQCKPIVLMEKSSGGV